MKFSSLLLLSSASSAVLAAPALHHTDRHHAKRDAVTVTQYFTEDEVVTVAENAPIATAMTDTPASLVNDAMVDNTATNTPAQTTHLTSTAAVTQEPLKTTTLVSSTTSASVQSQSANSVHGDLKNFDGPYSEFKDGTIQCSSFPSGDGVIPVEIGRAHV